MGEEFLYEHNKSPTSRRERRTSKKNKGLFVDFLLILLISFGLVFGVLRPFIVKAFYVPTESMVPTLLVNDRVLANEFIYRFSELERGEIVIFKVKSAEGEEEYLIKRVVGLPADKISVRSGRLFINGVPQKESYLNKKLPDKSFYGPTTVPPGHVFVMGDNRANSGDSRIFGPVPKKNIEGQAFVRFWPLSRIEIL